MDRRTAIIIPVKGSDPKSRLSGLLSLAERKQLQVAMLEDTLQTLIKAGRAKDAFVVSSDLALLEFTERFGANTVAEPGDQGVNSAVERGIAASSSFESHMVIPADLPLLSVQDLKAASMLVREGAKLVISPSEGFDGTNLLLLTKEGRLELHYDDDSFRKHVAGATSLGIPVAMYYSRGTSFDVDKAEDVHRFFKYHKAGSTLTFLGRTLRRTRRLPTHRSQG